MAPTLRIGSRPSRLALSQAERIRDRVKAAAPSLAIEIVAIHTSGDKMTGASLARVGGKGLFIKELEQALVERAIDIAVHSMKDLPAILTPGFRISAVPERADARDALISRAARGIASLTPGARLGTSSARRRFEALRLRPDLNIAPLRGNVDTRLRRVAAGDFHAIIVAMAGLERLGHAGSDEVAFVPLDESDFVPAGGQGALAVEALADQQIARSAELDATLSAIDDPRAHREVAAERAFLAALGASCVSPLGVRATINANTLHIRALLFSVDGSRHMSDELTEIIVPDAPLAQAEGAGTRLAQRMLAVGARELIADG
jgi:hydroxymethylbilane synthase